MRGISMPTIEVGTVSQQWKQTEALWKALHWWIGKLCWAHIGSEHTVTFLELAVDFELTTGERLPDVSDRRIQPPTMRKTKTTTAREILPPSEAQSGLCLYFDGGSRQNGTALAVAGAGAVVYEDGKKIAEVIVPLGRTTNNVAEFSALVGGLHLLGEQPPSVQGPVTVRGDSKVVISTMKKTAQCKPILRPYLLASMGALAPRFNFNLEHVARDRNTDADALSNAAMDQVQAQTSGEVSTIMAQYEAYRRSALAKARTLHTLANTAARIYGTAWHPGRVANVTSATALGGGVMQGVSCRAVLSPQTEAVLRSMSRGASDTEGTTPNPFVKAHESWHVSSGVMRGKVEQAEAKFAKMYAKKKTNINMHKSWHVNSGVMRGKVEQAEAKALHDAKRAEIREKEREKELEKKYYEDLQEKAGVVKKKKRMDWMYEVAAPAAPQTSGVEMISSDNLLKDQPKGDFAAAAQPKPEVKPTLAVDLEAKIRDDPMFAIKKAQMERLQQQFNDPMFALALQQRRKQAEAKRERIESKSAKKEKKDKRDKKEKKREKKEKKKQAKKEKKDRKRRRSTSSSSESSSSVSSGYRQRASKIPRVEDAQDGRGPPTVPHSAKYQRPARPVLSDEEKQRRLREMENDAKAWSDERSQRIAVAADKAKKEEDEDRVTHMGSKYLAEVNKKAMEKTLADRLHNRNYSSKRMRDDD
ncbi:Pre-mRNA-splicing factor cwc25 [Diplonema papillatum]|nr:Pre-mRNA-splicing factor cwc25 [Diplonema papillatum]